MMLSKIHKFIFDEDDLRDVYNLFYFYQCVFYMDQKIKKPEIKNLFKLRSNFKIIKVYSSIKPRKAKHRSSYKCVRILFSKKENLMKKNNRIIIIDQPQSLPTLKPIELTFLEKARNFLQNGLGTLVNWILKRVQGLVNFFSNTAKNVYEFFQKGLKRIFLFVRKVFLGFLAKLRNEPLQTNSEDSATLEETENLNQENNIPLTKFERIKLKRENKQKKKLEAEKKEKEQEDELLANFRQAAIDTSSHNKKYLNSRTNKQLLLTLRTLKKIKNRFHQSQQIGVEKISRLQNTKIVLLELQELINQLTSETVVNAASNNELSSAGFSNPAKKIVPSEIQEFLNFLKEAEIKRSDLTGQNLHQKRLNYLKEKIQNDLPITKDLTKLSKQWQGKKTTFSQKSEVATSSGNKASDSNSNLSSSSSGFASGILKRLKNVWLNLVPPQKLQSNFKNKELNLIQLTLRRLQNITDSIFPKFSSAPQESRSQLVKKVIAMRALENKLQPQPLKTSRLTFSIPFFFRKYPNQQIFNFDEQQFSKRFLRARFFIPFDQALITRMKSEALSSNLAPELSKLSLPSKKISATSSQALGVSKSAEKKASSASRTQQVQAYRSTKKVTTSLDSQDMKRLIRIAARRLKWQRARAQGNPSQPNIASLTKKYSRSNKR